MNAATFICAIIAHNAVVHGVIALGNKVNVKNNIICDAFEALCFAVIAVIDLAIHSPLADHVAFLRLGNDYHGVAVIGADASSGVFARVLLNPLLVKHLIADFSFQSIKGTADSTGVGSFKDRLNRGVCAELRDIVYGTAVVNDRAVSLPAIKNIAVIRLGRQGDRCGSRHIGKDFGAISRGHGVRVLAVGDGDGAISGGNAQVVAAQFCQSAHLGSFQHRKGIAASCVGKEFEVVLPGLGLRIVVRIGGCGANGSAVGFPACIRCNLIARRRLHGHLCVAWYACAGSYITGDRLGCRIIVMIPCIACTKVVCQGKHIAVPDKNRVKVRISLWHGDGNFITIVTRVTAAYHKFPVAEMVALSGYRLECPFRARGGCSAVGKAIRHDHPAGARRAVGYSKLVLLHLKFQRYMQRFREHGAGQSRVATVLDGGRAVAALDRPALDLIPFIWLCQEEQRRAVAECNAGSNQLFLCDCLWGNQFDGTCRVAVDRADFRSHGKLLAGDDIGGGFEGHQIVAAIGDAANDVLLAVFGFGSISVLVCTFDFNHIVRVDFSGYRVAAR